MSLEYYNINCEQLIVSVGNPSTRTLAVPYPQQLPAIPPVGVSTQVNMTKIALQTKIQVYKAHFCTDFDTFSQFSPQSIHSSG
jgi:hypothetical protein